MPLEKFCSEHFEPLEIIGLSRLYFPDLPFPFFDGSAVSVGSIVQSAERKLLATADNTASAVASV